MARWTERACPTEALKFEKSEDNASFALKFSARDCIGCDLCVRVCLPAAVSVDHAPTFAQVFGEEQTTLCEGELVKCERCGETRRSASVRLVRISPRASVRVGDAARV
ncbi:MAG: 4Fe-4S dicluster domain-containing protein [Anaerolineae bacterium]|nr:4Fe-4S dicluster domain-containing protein [Anaerolineae bacterium]